MAYVKTTWQDGNTYGASSFNNIENGIADCDKRLERIENGEIAFNTLYEFKETGEEGGKVQGELVRVAENLKNTEKMQRAGY